MRGLRVQDRRPSGRRTSVAYMRGRFEESGPEETSRVLDWDAAVRRVISEPGALRPAFQPIVDLRRGVVCGYEMLSRFAGPPEESPDVWFREAEAMGLRVELEARALEAGLESWATLPTDCFLTVNIDPVSLGEARIEGVWELRPDLHNLVIELTEDSQTDDDLLRFQLRGLRERGALVAIDDVGSGYSGLLRISTQRPEFIKVDRVLVEGLQHEAAKREMIESLGALAQRLGAKLIAEGIEETAELEALMRLGVPLGQGYALGRPSRGMAGPT